MKMEVNKDKLDDFYVEESSLITDLQNWFNHKSLHNEEISLYEINRKFDELNSNRYEMYKVVKNNG